ncbi:MAG: HAS-barrel domain-containing protein, partial [Candidatus Hydrothermarchaeaceae archaeon]
MVIGMCIGESSPTEVAFISKSMPAFGEYVVLEYDGKKVLGMVEALLRGSPSISGDILDPEVVERILGFEGEDQNYVRGKVRLLGDVDLLEMPRVPPPPGTKIKRASSKTLKKIFGNGTIKIGTLLSQPDVDVLIDGNRMITRHLAIL